jgi:pantetheine-phosphate adenylyltransferase
MEDTLSTPSQPTARRIAIYPGTFDPVHNGHVDIARRAASLFDELIIAVVADRPAKRLMFNASERIALVRESIGDTVDGCKITVETFSGLVVQYATSRGARAIVRGLRAVTDFEYEYQMTTMNRHLEPNVETVFLMTTVRFAYLSSTLLKEVAGLGADIDELVPAPVAAALADRSARARQ